MLYRTSSCTSFPSDSSSDEGYSSSPVLIKTAPPTKTASLPAKPISFTFLGTGGSSALPLISCVTEPDKACPSCYDTLWDPTSKNIRGNTGGIISVPQRDGSEA